MNADLHDQLSDARLMEARNPAAALQLCRNILRVDPRHFDALVTTGRCCYQLGKLDDALAAMQQALTIRPRDPVTIQTCSSLLIEAGQFSDAVALLDRALAIRPDAVPFLFNRALALAILGRTQDALADYDRVIILRPDYQEGWLARGNLLRQTGRPEEALTNFDKVLESEPHNANAHRSRGLLLAEINRTGEALLAIDKVLESNPAQAGVLLDRCRLLRKLGRYDEALQAADAARTMDNGNSRAWNACGTILMDIGRPAEALSAYSKAIELDANYAEALLNRGLLQWTQWRQYDEAVTDLERAVTLAPDHTTARGELLHIRMYGGEWKDFLRDKEILDRGVRGGELVVRPFAYQAISASPSDLAACSGIFAGLFPPLRSSDSSSLRPSHRIRVGYLSADFREHATSYLMAGLYERHDRTAFEVLAIDSGYDDGSPVRKRLEGAFDRIIDIANLTDQEAAARIAAAQVDILVNLNGYFGNYRMGVFSHKPAPIQVNYLGFPATLGATYIDYIIADRIVIPEDEQRFYTEKVVYLPGCYQPNDDRRVRPTEIPSREACGLPDGAFVYCNFNQSYKLTPDTYSMWMRILHRVPNSVLWLVNDLPAFRMNAKREAAQHGVSPDRIVLANRVPADRHLARLAQADLMLDNLPYNAHTTGSDALWMDVPLLTCRGTSFPGRVAASLLTAVGMQDMITDDLQAYEQLAVTLGLNRDRLAELKARLATNRRTCALFDTDRQRRHIEEVYREMQARRLRGDAPASFGVGPASVDPT